MFITTVTGWPKSVATAIIAGRWYAVRRMAAKASQNSHLKPLYLDVQATTPMVTACFIFSIESNRLPIAENEPLF